MPTIELTTHLDADQATVRAQVMRPAVLPHVSAPLLRFRPIEPSVLPDIWQGGDCRLGMSLFGIVPLGWQIVGIEPQPMRDGIWSIRDNGRGRLIRTWDHWIEVAPESEGTRYTDRVTVDAGVLTPFVALFARIFYAHRQRRWRRLVANDFHLDR
ncbi:MAG: hypothetical protein JJ926_17775 [Roseitalea sp.]|jgi:hypothetical protein|uniref:SRPBCC family protein n=1 Tax=Oceaniradius stylonematis TaxID=2184161 RepID=A0A3A8AIC2_9HYPH|nr:hypothetical protein [Oceaniradius stylonematis]MBO6554702.1 hypothetical protein [Roseitalea sp.]MBO6953729.1 hypothetical protein [Rhizobiaceae bacterium]RNC96795.1 MAG: hypothetical protein ED558_02735 [Oricola sp.]MBO6594078.1 hypothetical protein [Roseitalea sp.]MBO6601489.1 hypothetical protein [Roseitalea sp.]